MSKFILIILALMLSACSKAVYCEVSDMSFEVKGLSHVPETSSSGYGITSNGSMGFMISGTDEAFYVVLANEPCSVVTIESKKLFGHLSLGDKTVVHTRLQKFDDGDTRCELYTDRVCDKPTGESL